MGSYFEQDELRDLAERLAAEAVARIRSAVGGDAALRSALEGIKKIVEDRARRQIEDERGRNDLERTRELDRIRSDWEADKRGRSDYLTQIERRRAQLHSALLLVNMRLQTIIALCPDNEFKAAILDVLADIKDAISKQQTKEEPT